MTTPCDKTGSCLCGNVRFQITGAFDSFFLCHCSRCRKSTGSAHGANLFSTNFSLNWLSGEEDIKHFNVPETRHVRSFCQHCGSTIPNIQMDGKLLMVPAGSLDCEVEIKPNGHIFMSDRAQWDDGFAEVAKFAAFPS